MEHIVPNGYIHFVEEKYDVKYREERAGSYVNGTPEEVIQEAPFVISGYDSLILETMIGGANKTLKISYVYRIKTQIIDAVSFFRCKKTVSIGPDDCAVESFNGEDYLTLLIDKILRKKMYTIPQSKIMSISKTEINLLKDVEARTKYKKRAKEIGAEILELTALIVNVDDIAR